MQFAGLLMVIPSLLITFLEIILFIWDLLGIIFVIYAIILVLLLFILGYIELLNSISLAFATLINGGFVPTATVLTLENPITLIVIIGGMIIEALPFILLIVLMLIGRTEFSTAGGLKITRLMLIFEKIFNIKKPIFILINKNHSTMTSFISSDSIQFQRKIKHNYLDINNSLVQILF